MALRLAAIAAALCAATVSAQSLEHVQGEFEYVGASARGERKYSSFIFYK